MLSKASRLTSWFVIVLVTSFSTALLAQTSDTSSSETHSASEKKTHDILENIKFRNQGPAVGGGMSSSTR